MEDVRTDLESYAVGGVQITAVKDDHISKWFAKGVFYEAAMLDHIRDTYPRGLTFIDVGAHVGNHSLYFYTHCEAEQVFAFEPNPELFQILQGNLEGRGAIHAAVGERAGWVRVEPWPLGNSGMGRVSPGGDIPLVTLDGTCGFADLIKIDAEGMGAAVLRGARRILRMYHPAIFIEAATQKEFIETAGILNPLGYTMRSKWNSTPTYEFKCSST